MFNDPTPQSFLLQMTRSARQVVCSNGDNCVNYDYEKAAIVLLSSLVQKTSIFTSKILQIYRKNQQSSQKIWLVVLLQLKLPTGGTWGGSSSSSCPFPARLTCVIRKLYERLYKTLSRSCCVMVRKFIVHHPWSLFTMSRWSSAREWPSPLHHYSTALW